MFEVIVDNLQIIEQELCNIWNNVLCHFNHWISSRKTSFVARLQIHIVLQILSYHDLSTTSITFTQSALFIVRTLTDLSTFSFQLCVSSALGKTLWMH